MIRRKSIFILAIAMGMCSLLFHWVYRASASDTKKHVNSILANENSSHNDNAIAASAFEAMVPVLHHPRCMNCHSIGDFPRQGDDEHRHKMNVRRGTEGQGVAGLKCSTCHQAHNLAGEHMPPGAPGWHLPSSHEPMIWEGLSDTQLCELFKNPAQNGHRTVDQIVQHMSTPLVLWGWHPGEGRTPVPVPEKEFLAKVKDWASHGAACPK